MTSVEIRYLATGRHRVVSLNTVTFARELTAKTGAFLEFTSTAGDGSHVATVNTGLTHHVDPNTQFDLGLNYGISKSAPDLTLFFGFAKRY